MYPWSISRSRTSLRVYTDEWRTRRDETRQLDVHVELLVIVHRRTIHSPKGVPVYRRRKVPLRVGNNVNEEQMVLVGSGIISLAQQKGGPSLQGSVYKRDVLRNALSEILLARCEKAPREGHREGEQPISILKRLLAGLLVWIEDSLGEL